MRNSYILAQEKALLLCLEISLIFYSYDKISLFFDQIKAGYLIKKISFAVNSAQHLESCAEF